MPARSHFWMLSMRSTAWFEPFRPIMRAASAPSKNSLGWSIAPSGSDTCTPYRNGVAVTSWSRQTTRGSAGSHGESSKVSTSSGVASRAVRPRRAATLRPAVSTARLYSWDSGPPVRKSLICSAPGGKHAMLGVNSRATLRVRANGESSAPGPAMSMSRWRKTVDSPGTGAPDLDVTDLNGSHFEAHDGPPGDSILAHAQARVEGAAQRVAEEVGAQHGDHDGQAGERRDPPGAADVVAALADHPAPARRGRLHAEAQERQRRLDDDQLGELEARHHDGGTDDVRRDVAEEDPRGPAAEGARSDHEVPLPGAQRHHADQPRVHDPAPEHEHDDQVHERGLEERHHRDREEQVGKRELDLGQPHDDAIRPRAGVSGQKPEQDAERPGQEDGRTRDAE